MSEHLFRIRTAYGKGSLPSGLSFIEGGRDIPFDIRALVCLYDASGLKKYDGAGNHVTAQALFCPHGSVSVTVFEGGNEETVTLDDPSVGLRLPAGTQKSAVFHAPGTVLCIAEA